MFVRAQSTVTESPILRSSLPPTTAVGLSSAVQPGRRRHLGLQQRQRLRPDGLGKLWYVSSVRVRAPAQLFCSGHSALGLFFSCSVLARLGASSLVRARSSNGRARKCRHSHTPTANALSIIPYAVMALFVSEMYKALTTSGGTDFGVSFPESVFVIGLPATPWAAGSGYATPEKVSRRALHSKPLFLLSSRPFSHSPSSHSLLVPFLTLPRLLFLTLFASPFSPLLR